MTPDETLERVVRLETQRADHEQVHVLEDKALTVAFQEMKSHLSDHNQILDKWQISIAELKELMGGYISRKEALALVLATSAIVSMIVTVLTHFVMK